MVGEMKRRQRISNNKLCNSEIVHVFRNQHRRLDGAAKVAETTFPQWVSFSSSSTSPDIERFSNNNFHRHILPFELIRFFIAAVFVVVAIFILFRLFLMTELYTFGIRSACTSRDTRCGFCVESFSETNPWNRHRREESLALRIICKHIIIWDDYSQSSRLETRVPNNPESRKKTFQFRFASKLFKRIKLTEFRHNYPYE